MIFKDMQREMALQCVVRKFALSPIKFGKGADLCVVYVAPTI